MNRDGPRTLRVFPMDTDTRGREVLRRISRLVDVRRRDGAVRRACRRTRRASATSRTTWTAPRLTTTIERCAEARLVAWEAVDSIHVYPTLAEANKYAAGVWKKAHAPQGVLRQVERYHAWMRG